MGTHYNEDVNSLSKLSKEGGLMMLRVRPTTSVLGGS